MEEKMGRRYDHSSVELKELMLKSAEDLINAEGYRNLTARKISKQMNYSVGTLYNIFDNLNDIIMHVNARTLKKIKNQFIKKTQDSPNDIVALAYTYINFWDTNTQLADMLFNYKQPANLDIPSFVQNEINHIYQIIIDILMPKLNNNSELAQTTCAVLWGGLHGICVLTMGGKMGLFSSETAHKLGESFVSGYLKGVLS